MKHRNRLLSSIIFAFVWLIAGAQLPHDFRSEQVALSPRQASCLPGDSVIVQGQVTCLAANRILPFSNYVYVELISPGDSVLVRQKVSCKDSGAFVTALPVDPLEGFGIYYIRAYTTLMRNFSPESFAVEPLLVGKAFPDYDRTTAEGMKCTIVPNGGHLCSGTLQNVTIRLSNYLDDPISDVELKLVSESGEEINAQRTSASGLAVMSFIPQPGMRYNIRFEYERVKQEFAVPESTEGAPVVEGMVRGTQVAFTIKGVAGDISKLQLYAYDRQNGISRITLDRSAGSFRLANAPQVITLFLTDENMKVISEYTAIARPEALMPLELPQVASVGKPVKLPEVSEGTTMIARLVPEKARWVDHAESQLLYLSDFRSPLPFPERYYTLDERERNGELKAWLGTATFKRFDIGEAVARDSSIYSYMPESVMYFTGKVETPSRKPFAKGMLIAYNTETNMVYNADLNEKGEFVIAVDDFSDGTEFFLQAVDEKGKPKAMYIKMPDETYPALVISQRKTLGKNKYAKSEVSYEGGNWDKQELPEVVVKARTKYDNLHSTDRFYGHSFKSREVIQERGFRNLYDILKDIPGLIVVRAQKKIDDEDDDDRGGRDPGKVSNMVTVGGRAYEIKQDTYVTEYAIYPTRGMSTLGGGNQVVMLLDGARTPEPLTSLMEITADEIESVEYLRPWQALAYTYGAIAGAVNITTRKGLNNQKKEKSLGTMYSPLGLATAAEPEAPIAEKPGKYRLIVDLISASGIHSYESEVIVPAD